jgi:hypothetical protein
MTKIKIQKPRTASFAQNKSGQEEFVGFGLIIIIVAVILLIFIGFAMKKNSSSNIIESYEIESFIQSMLQYTTDCEDNVELLSVQKLIFSCRKNAKCLDGRETCEVLNDTLEDIATVSWGVGEDYLAKGYELIIVYGGDEMINIQKGNSTNNYKGSKQSFSKEGNDIEIIFTANY